jgi:formyltetrahydrofolate hydrolase
MRVLITAVGVDDWGLADPILHYVTAVGAHIAEIQMYDHGDGGLFALLLRLKWPGTRNTLAQLRAQMAAIGRESALSIRVWARDARERPPRLAVCVTHRREPALAVLEAVRAGSLRATPVVLIGNRPACQAVADQFGLDWHMIGDAHAQHMLTYGATVHFIVPELDAGGQIIHQETFTIAPGTPLAEIVRTGLEGHEPRRLVEGLRRVLDREVDLRFRKVVAVPQRSECRRREEGPTNTVRAGAEGQSLAAPASPRKPGDSTPVAASAGPTPSVIQVHGRHAAYDITDTPPRKPLQAGQGNAPTCYPGA